MDDLSLVPETCPETWSVAGRTFTSRLIVGTGKYKDYAQNAAAARAHRAGGVGGRVIALHACDTRRSPHVSGRDAA